LLCRDCASNRVDDARKPHQHAVAGGLLDDARARSPSYSVDGPRSSSRPYVIFGRHPVFCEKIGSVAQQRRAPWGRLRSPPLLVRRWIPRLLWYRTGSGSAIAFAPVPRVNFAFYLGSDQENFKLHFEEIERAAG